MDMDVDTSKLIPLLQIKYSKFLFMADTPPGNGTKSSLVDAVELLQTGMANLP